MFRRHNAYLPLLVALTLPMIGQSAALAAPSAKPPPQTPTVDPQAMNLVRAVDAKMTRLRTFFAVYTERFIYPPDWIHNYRREFRSSCAVDLMRPNFASIRNWEVDKVKANGVWTRREVMDTSASDGDNVWRWFGYDGTYRKTKANAAGMDYLDLTEPARDFFGSGGSLAKRIASPGSSGTLLSVRYLGEKPWRGAMYKTVEWRLQPGYDFGAAVDKRAPGGKVVTTTDLYIGSDDLVHRMKTVYNIGWINDIRLESVKCDSPMSRESFAYKLPAGAHLPAPAPAVLADGTVAPDFSLAGADGKTVTLSQYRGHVVVLDFWSTWCGPCQESLPTTAALAAKLAPRGVVFLAVDVWDTQAAYDKWIPLHTQMSALHFAIDPRSNNTDIATAQYNVTGIPTQFVIDPSGKISASFVGYDSNTGDSALEKAVLKACGS